MRYVVRTVAWRPERLANVAAMRKAIPHLEVVTDTIGNGYASFFDACHLINETGGVLLEDDVCLCRDFLRRCEGIINDKGSDHVINFFERPKVPLETKLVGGSQFLWMQCVYLPPIFPAKCVAYHDEFKAARPQKWEGMATDVLISYALTKEKMRYWRIRPTLVQHLPYDSVIGHRPNNRQTLFFVDDIEDRNAVHIAE